MRSALDILQHGPNKLATPLAEGAVSFNNQDKHVERIARGYFLGATSFNKKKEIRQQLEDRVVSRIGKRGKLLTDKLFELAQGVYIAEKVGNKVVKYYQVPPSLPAITYMLDRVLGKPTQYVDKGDGAKQGIVVVESIIKNLAGGGTVEVKKSVEITQ